MNSILILAFALAEGIYRSLNDTQVFKDDRKLRIWVPFVFGFGIFALSQFKTLVYVKIILKNDLSSQRNLIKKGFFLFLKQNYQGC